MTLSWDMLVQWSRMSEWAVFTKKRINILYKVVFSHTTCKLFDFKSFPLSKNPTTKHHDLHLRFD